MVSAGAVLLLLAQVTTRDVHAIETIAREMILVDAATGTVLAEKEPDERMPPSSMSKLMTLYVAFELLRDGKLRLEDSFRVSEKAWRMGGSKMWVQVDTKVTVEELLKGIIIQSGNDACIVLAEGISGSEEAFAELLNKRAKEIGLAHSHFKNATGWPDPDHYMTARDLAILAYHLVNDFPDFYRVFSEKSYTYNKITQGNRNPLLYNYAGGDGLKTGHTEEAGYGLTASAIRDGRRLILVVNGLAGVNERARETERLLDIGFNEFKNYFIFKAGERVYDMPVWLGTSDVVPAVVPNDIVVTLPKRASKSVSIRVVAPGPAHAPVAKDSKIAKLVISAPDFGPIESKLVAGASVEEVSGFGRIGPAISRLFSGD
ncbi:MAG: D-alanyl-D-alanine carboxypeptidase [Alphaproteobacteria bacterium]|nr:D-alanyl-D-alanine carboxypeptidase [Alphaproteobacteria bacterium]